MQQPPAQPNIGQQARVHTQNVNELSQRISQLTQQISGMDAEKRKIDTAYTQMINRVGQYENIKGTLTQMLRVYANDVLDKDAQMAQKKTQLVQTQEQMAREKETHQQTMNNLKQSVVQLQEEVKAAQKTQQALSQDVANIKPQAEEAAARANNAQEENRALQSDRDLKNNQVVKLKQLGQGYTAQIQQQQQTFQRIKNALDTLSNTIGLLDKRILPEYVRNYMQMPLLAQMRFVFRDKLKEGLAGRQYAGALLDDALVSQYDQYFMAAWKELSAIRPFLKANLQHPSLAGHAPSWQGWLNDLDILYQMFSKPSPYGVTWRQFYVALWTVEQLGIPPEKWSEQGSEQVGAALKKATGV
jgi:uncharacterized small protein (DUF1192 family)